MFSGFCLDIEKAAVPVKCLSPIIYVTLKVVCENNDFTIRVDSRNNVLIATLRDNIFTHAGPLSKTEVD